MQQPVWVTVKLFIVYIVYTQWVNRQSSEHRFATAYNIRSDAKLQLSLTKEIENGRYFCFLFSEAHSTLEMCPAYAFRNRCVVLFQGPAISPRLNQPTLGLNNFVLTRLIHSNTTRNKPSSADRCTSYPFYPIRQDPEQAEFCRTMHILSVV